MVPPQISEQVLRFINERIDSVPQLEALVMMNDQPLRAWTAADVAARIYVSPEEATRVLEALHRQGLIARAAEGAAFCMGIADETERVLVDEVARTYRANLTRIATFIHEKPPASLKEFARAFSLKKDR